MEEDWNQVAQGYSGNLDLFRSMKNARYIHFGREN